jgi:predicted DNA-binding transcriptional regulator AlpA
MMVEEKQRIPSQEVMRLLGITRPTLYRLITEGKLTAPEKSPWNTKRGRLDFDPAEVAKLVAEDERLRKEASGN